MPLRPAIPCWPLLAVALLPLAGCVVPAPYSAAAGTASLPLSGRTITDMAVSLAVGADCSLVRLDSGKPYCMREPPPVPPPVCTRTLGTVECWTNPEAFGAPVTGVADGPSTLTPGQEKHRMRWGTGL